MNLAFEYINYCLKAKNRHGIHSPYVYDFSDKLLKTAISRENSNRLNKYKKAFQYSNETIQITDLGVGSKRMGNERKIKDIAKNSGSNGKYGKLLFRIANYYKPKKILELGTSLGIGTNAMFLGNPKVEITTVEGCPETFKTVLNHWKKIHKGDKNSSKTTFIQSDFKNFLTNSLLNPEQIKFDLIYIDGHHDGIALLNYLDQLQNLSHSETIFLIDDIRWSDSMKRAWKLIISNPDFHVTIELFRMGIAVRRTEQMKEHFVVAY